MTEVRQRMLVKTYQGYSLIEVMVGLLILGIIIPPFLGVFISFTKTNAISRHTLATTMIANNHFEILKKHSLLELLSFNHETDRQEGLYGILTMVTPYYLEEAMSESSNFHLVIGESEQNITGYVIPPNLNPIIWNLSGPVQSLSVDISITHERIVFVLRDELGNEETAIFSLISCNQPITLSIHLKNKPQDLDVQLALSSSDEENLSVYIYDQPNHWGDLVLSWKDQTVTLERMQILPPMDGLHYLYIGNFERDTCLLNVNATVKPIEGVERKPVIRQGLIRVPY